MFIRPANRLLSRVFLHFVLPALLVCGLSLHVFADTITFDASTPAANRTIDVDNTQYEGFDIIVSGITVTINGTHTFASLTVQNGGSVTHSPGLIGGMNLTITTSMQIQPNASISVTGQGYAPRSVAEKSVFALVSQRN